MARRGQAPAYRLEGPVSVEVRFKNYRPAELLAWLPGFERVDAHAVRYTARDMPEAARISSFLQGYRVDLAP
jgi:D-aminopeptidase